MEPNIPYSMADIMRLAQSPAGQQLFALLQQQNHSDLQKAIHSATSGDYKNAQAILSALMNSPEAQSLLKQMGG